jgi:hypothetical protein
MFGDFFVTFYLKYTSILKSTHISLCNTKFGKSLTSKQCSGSVGSRKFLFLGLPDPDPLFRGTDLDPSIIKQKW